MKHLKDGLYFKKNSFATFDIIDISHTLKHQFFSF